MKGSKRFIKDTVDMVLGMAVRRWPGNRKGYDYNKRVSVYRAIAKKLTSIADTMERLDG